MAKYFPPYTRGEEIFNAVSHIVGGALGILALVMGVVFAVIYQKTTDSISHGIKQTINHPTIKYRICDIIFTGFLSNIIALKTTPIKHKKETIAKITKFHG